MKKMAVIVAGGRGTRMGQEMPKQFLLLKGQPIIIHVFNCFYQYDPNIEFILVLARDLWDTWQILCGDYGFKLPHHLAPGGETRFHSVKNGLEFVKEPCLVAVHDAARPFASQAAISRCFETALKKGSAIPVVDLNESLRYSDGLETRSLPRSYYKLVQTPQVFHSVELKKAYSIDFDSSLTDDASVVERAGGKVNLVQGNYENIKITHPVDIKIAEAIYGFLEQTEC